MALILLLVSAVLLVARLYAAYRVGFGDSEALYACYALHPQPAYLDHPGLIGLFARWLGSGAAPTPTTAHLVTAILATLLPWVGVLAARAAGSSWRAAFVAGLVYAVTPEIAVGLFAMTPDLLLSFAWLGTLALALSGLRAPPSSARAAMCLLAAGLFAGVATASKVSGATLFVVLAMTYATQSARGHSRSGWPWAGLVAGLIVVAPVVLFEARSGWPMLRHRLVETQQGAGPSLRNLGAFLGGQLVYLSPLVAVAAVIVGLDLWRTRKADDGTEPSQNTGRLLFMATVVPLIVLVPLSLWSRVAEPHWVAPALLALPLYAARRASETRVLGRRFLVATIATAGVIAAAVYAWVLVPSLVHLVPRTYDPRYDLANELEGWPAAVEAVRETAVEQSHFGLEAGDLAIVGPHWTVCAQLHAALRETWPAPTNGPPAPWRIGCMTPIPDDFDTWSPRATWQTAEVIVFVTDNRFEVDPVTLFPAYAPLRARTVTVERGGRLARAFHIVVMVRRASS